MITKFNKIILNTNNCIDYLKCQNYFYGNIALNNVVASLKELLNFANDETLLQAFTPALNGIMNAQLNNDYVLVADLLELMLLPVVNEYLTPLISDAIPNADYFEKNIDALKETGCASLIDIVSKTPSNNYVIEYTNSGEFTLKHTGTKEYYFHSNKNPYEEAKKFAKYYIQEGEFCYTVFGLGLGYHIKALLEEDRRITVRVIECCPDIIATTFRYMDMTSLITNTRFTLEYVPENKLGDMISTLNNSILLMHYPSINTIQSDDIRNVLNEYFVSISSMYSQKKELDSNFYYNTKRDDPALTNILADFNDKRLIYIAGGPSLHYYIEDIKELHKQSDVIIICASTVYRNLLKDGIIPNYVIIIDAKDNMINHLIDIPSQGSKLLYLCTASSDAVNAFDGEKYIILQNDYPLAEELAKKLNSILINTGGSVSTAAIDIILQSKAKELITYGLDLAYTDNKTHSYEAVNKGMTDNSLMVKSVNGNTIPTTKNLNIYRKWIEKRIASESNIKLTNYSHGAYINGMENIY